MSHGWSGADPTQTADGGSYELGTEFLVGATDITVTAVRVFSGATPGAVPGRLGRLWSSTGTLLGTAMMDAALPAGWVEYALSSPLVRAAGTRFVVSYTTGGFYAALIGGLSSDVVSSDGAVTALSSANGTHGNGSFTSSTTAFPDVASSNSSFYGIDVVYTVNSGGNTPPVIVGMSAISNGLGTVTSQINATDAETLVGATYGWVWGDGASTLGLSVNHASHTYTAPGLYAVLGTVTDAGGLSANAARAVDVELPDPAVTQLDIGGVIDQLASHAATLGVIDGPVNGHEPLSPPGSGVTAAVWFNTIRPARGASGLNATTVVVVCTVRLYKPLLSQPQDAIDPALTAAMNLLMATYSRNFTLGGTVRNVDLLGQFGVPLWSESAYQTIEVTQYRVVSITVPLVVNDVWQQAA